MRSFSHAHHRPRSLRTALGRGARRNPHVTYAEKTGAKAEDNASMGVGLKAVWYGAEQFGKLIGGNKQSREGSTNAVVADGGKVEWCEVLKAIREDYDANYFISGEGDMAVYDPQCTFADPFASFKGVDRFKQNVSNLGGLMENVNLKITDWQELEEGKLKASWAFSGTLNLPWRPLLAAAGTTTHTCDPETGLVVSHYEDWNVDVKDVLQRLLKPGNKIPQNEAEVFMASVSSGDVLGAWQVMSGYLIKYTGPVVGISLLVKAATGSGLPGPVLGTVEGVSYIFFFGGIATWGITLMRDLTGNESK